MQIRKLNIFIAPSSLPFITFFAFHFQDYHNITPRRFYLPPLNQQQQHWRTTPVLTKKVVSTHKTFTTRKGALLLYAEDLALTCNEQQQEQQAVQKTKALEAEDTNLFHTFDDLRNAILSYGAKVRIYFKPVVFLTHIANIFIGVFLLVCFDMIGYIYCMCTAIIRHLFSRKYLCSHKRPVAE